MLFVRDSCVSVQFIIWTAHHTTFKISKFYGEFILIQNDRRLDHLFVCLFVCLFVFCGGGGGGGVGRQFCRSSVV